MTSDKTANLSIVSIRDVIGGGYDEFWRSKKRYVVCKGSRASKKSTTAALKLIVRLMQMPLANALVVRQTAATLKDSCYAQLRWAVNRLGVEKFWKCTINPLQMTYLPTGQKIIFRGLDDGLKITSIAVEQGHLCFAWGEEAFEFTEDTFNRVDESLRGKLPEGYYLQWVLTLNPWSSSSWIKARFFDKPSDNVLAMTTTYKCNEWLSENDLALFEEIRQTDPDRYKIVGLGEWGLEGGQYFSEWRESKHVIKPFAIPRDWVKFRSMDFGQARPYAVLWFAIDYDGNMYAYRELYGWGGKPNVGTGETAKQIGEKIVALEKPEEGLRYGILDSACWARTGVTGPSIEEELNRVLIANKLMAFSKSSKGRLEGANAFKQRLIGNTLEDGTTKPAIYFFSTCIHSIRTIPLIGHDKHKPELPDTDAEDHCFVAGTLIATERGDIPIEDVTLADRVLTRKGFKQVLAAGMTKRDAQVVTVMFSNGRSLTGTGNHPVFIQGKGFVPLDSVAYGDRIHGLSSNVPSMAHLEAAEHFADGDKKLAEDDHFPNLGKMVAADEHFADGDKKDSKHFIQVDKKAADEPAFAVWRLMEKNRADVYNLTVDEEHEYFANGFLVHNCMDSAIYACLSRPWAPVKKNTVQLPPDRWRREQGARSAWTY